MKKLDANEFDSIKVNKVFTKLSEKSGYILQDFLDSGADVVEIEEKDFQNQFDFSDKSQRDRASGALRNKAKTIEFRRYDIAVRTVNARIFVGKHDVLFKPDPWYKPSRCV